MQEAKLEKGLEEVAGRFIEGDEGIKVRCEIRGEDSEVSLYVDSDGGAWLLEGWRTEDGEGFKHWKLWDSKDREWDENITNMSRRT